MKLVVVVGTRPEAIKMAPLIVALERSELFDCVVAVTGQHREMLDQILGAFAIVPRRPPRRVCSFSSSSISSGGASLPAQPWAATACLWRSCSLAVGTFHGLRR